MSNDYFKAQGWFKNYARSSEDSRGMFQRLVKEDEEAFKLASAETDKIKDMINKKYGSGSMKYGSEIPQPATRDDVIQIDAINSFMKRNPAAEGGRIPFGKGKDVKIGGNQWGAFETTYKKPTTTLDKYQTILDDFDVLVNKSLKLNDGTKLPKDFKQYVNDYTFPDGTKAKYNTYANLVARRSDPKYTKSLKAPVDVVKVKLSIMDNLIAESNAGNKATNLTTLAKKVNWTDKDISNYKRQGKIKKLDSPADKIDKVYKNLFNDLDAPLESFFNPRDVIAEKTGLNKGTVSTLLNKNPNYTEDGKRLFKALGTYALKGKYADQGLTIGQFLDDFENRLFIGENGLLSLKNYNKPVSSIVQDAWRHTSQGGKQIEWINLPKMNKEGELISLADAQFKYTGPKSSDTIWSASGNTVDGVKSKSIAIFGKDAPEFQKVFQDYDDIFRLENEIKPHPVTGKPTKMIDISKEAYNIGKGYSFGTTNLSRDHVNLIKDVFGNDPKYGSRILPRRVNEYAGALKTIEKATKKGIGKNYTQNKIDKIYEKMGYNFTKNYDQILNDEYNLAKKVFNKFQGAGWGFDQNTNKWVIKEGFDVETAKNIDARGNPKNPNKILQSPFKMVEDKEIELSKKNIDVPPKKIDYIGGQGGTTLSSGFNTDLLMKDKTIQKIVNSQAGKAVANGLRNAARSGAGAAGKVFGIADIVLGVLDLENNLSKGESFNVAAKNAVQAASINLLKVGDEAKIKEIRERFVAKGGDGEIFDQATDLNKKDQEINDLIYAKKRHADKVATQFGENPDFGFNSTIEDKKEYYNNLKKESNEKIAKAISERDDMVRSYKTNLQVSEAGAPINIGGSEFFGKPFRDIKRETIDRIEEENKFSYPMQKRQLVPTAGNIGNWLLNNVMTLNPQEKIKMQKYINEMDERELYKFNLGRGMDPDNLVRFKDILRYKSQFSELMGPNTTKYINRADRKSEGGITGLRSKYEYKK